MPAHKHRQGFLNLICRASIAFAVLCVLMAQTTLADDKAEKEQGRVKESGEALDALVNSESGIPTDLLNKSECVIILPSVKKGGFIVAGQYGKGLMSCRTGAKFDGPWSAPIMMQSSGGSVGLQAGGQAVDFVVLVLNDKGARKIMNGKAKLGADASIAARSGRQEYGSGHQCCRECGNALLFAHSRGIRRSVLVGDVAWTQAAMRTKICMGKK